MATQTAHLASALTPQQHIQADEVANQVYAAHYSERRTARIAIGTLTLLSLVLTGAVVLIANRPALTRYVRIDDAGRAQAIQYSDLNYSPREGEIRTYITDWLNYRHTINRETIAKKYPMNYYFLSSQLASQLINDDNNNHLSSQVLAGQMEQSDVQVNNVTITSMTQERIANAIVSRGTALINFDKIYSSRNSQKPRTEHWISSITYYVNPAQVSDHAKTNPQYETINPLGVTITEFHENRVSVDQTPEGSTYHSEAKP
ncbi:VirB8/TrbF family protein [Tunturiibacter gelidoferens]|uniref:Type IV secretion system protein VirB5 n=1 Tax=Tunturiibacter lichenicola TaxID=2051959 RepID=A0A7Y9NRC7_9BACT|nr:VirB8/TrbF family protein [Edaphobacter lichenicola]NYF54114.1 type IV secretion system protein VirB5 [Edaphobacter lichenicola]